MVPNMFILHLSAHSVATAATGQATREYGKTQEGRGEAEWAVTECVCVPVDNCVYMCIPSPKEFKVCKIIRNLK